MSGIVQSPSISKNRKTSRSNRTGQILRSMKLIDEASSPMSTSALKSMNSSISQVGVPNTSQNIVKFNETFDESLHNVDNMTIDPTRALVDISQINTPTKYAMGYDILSYSAANNPGVTVADGLFGDFKDRFLHHNSSSEVFHLLESYKELCTDYVTLLSKIVSQVLSKEVERPVQDLRNLLTQEKRTWKLIDALYRDRLSDLEEEKMNVDLKLQYSSEKTVMEENFKQSPDIRQAQIVIDWLEENASEELLTVTESFQHFNTGRASWENTLYQLKKKSETGRSLRSNIITELDPDAPSRTNKLLDELDREDEARFLKCIFSCIRSGRIDEAEDLCTLHGQPWRVAALEGWRLCHDSNMITATDDGGLLPLEGNARRKLWKLAAWHCSNNTTYGINERAIYGALCGNLKAMLNVSQSWEDCLWAYYKTMVDVASERVLQRSPHITLPWQHVKDAPLPDDYYMQQCDLNDLKEVFDKVSSSSDKAISAGAKSYHHVVQRCIILNDIEGLLEQMIIWLDTSSLSEHLLRFFAHLLLLLRTLGVPLDPSKSASILEAYVMLLIEDERCGHLVAIYTASLPPEAQLSCYASFLETITDSALRKKYVNLADEAGLDIRAITKNVVERIRASGDTESFVVGADISMSENPVLDQPLTADDRRKIEALEWLVFDPSQRAEALKQSNAVIRHFLASKKHSTARQAIQMIPSDSIKIIHREWYTMADKDVPLPAETENAEREHFAMQAFLLAQKAFSDWFKHYHNKPRPYESANRSSTFTNVSISDVVADEHRQKTRQDEIQRWKEMLEHLSDDASNKLYNVLLFPNGGWLTDTREMETSEENDCRRRQMELLRRLYIPSLCNLLLNVILDTGGRNEQCAKLANVLADEDKKLYEIFSDAEGQKILLRIQDALVDVL